MEELYVIDTVAFINYFNDFFQEEDRLSKNIRNTISLCLNVEYPAYKLSIPSVVFIEIFEKFLRGNEIVRKFRYEILTKIQDNEYVEIKSIDKEVLEKFIKIDDDIVKLEYHDKIIAASALQLDKPLITCDSKIQEYMRKSHYPIQLYF